MTIEFYPKASEAEELIMPIVISFIENKFPIYGILPVKNYDKKNTYTKHWQDAGVDLLLFSWKKEHMKNKEFLYIDAKCHAKYQAPAILYFELQVLDRYTRKELHSPWTDISEILEKGRQWILFASRKRMILIKKLEFQKFKEKHPKLVDVDKIDDYIDMDHPDVVKKNFSLNLRDSKEFELFKEMDPIVYELDNHNHWTKVNITNYWYLNFIK